MQNCVGEILLLKCRGGVEDTRLEAKAKDTKKNPRPRPRTQKKSEAKAKDSLSEDRHSRGQGQECSRPRPRTKDTSASALQKKKGLHKNFQAISTSSVARGGAGGLEPPHWLVKYAKTHVFCAFEADFL